MRIVTRPDFDGIVCAILLSEALDISEPVKWVEPNAMQRGVVEIREGDIIANLPYSDKCTLWFDHHYTNRIYDAFEGVFKIAPSAAGLLRFLLGALDFNNLPAGISATGRTNAMGQLGTVALGAIVQRRRG